MKTLIKGGTIITSADVIKADILIEDEKIKAIGYEFPGEDIESTFYADGKIIMPGGVDIHTHFDLPMFGTVSSDDHYTGHKAAAFGGTTTVIDFVSQDKATLKDSVSAWHQKADQKAAIDFGFHMNITNFDEEIAKEIPQLKKLGINSIKVFTAYNNRLRLDDGNIFKVMRIAKDCGILVMVHAENGDIIEVLVDEALRAGHTEPIWHARTRPTLGEVESVYRTIKISQLAESPVYIVHMNSKGGVELVREARQIGLPVMGETCPQYLFFTAEDLVKNDGSKYICSPPIRSKEDNAGIWQAVENDTLQVMSTDHCPFFFNGSKPIEYEGEKIAIPGKELGKNDFTKIPNGLPGIGDRMQIMWTKGVVEGRISVNRFVQMMCTNPAKIFGLYPKKGTLQPGSDADITIWNPNKEFLYGVKYSQQRTDYNLYEGWKLKGAIEKVFLRGKLIVDDQKWLGNRGEGRYIQRGEITII
jgi:dihydropyrimidinase